MEDIYTPGYDSLLKRKEAEFRRAKLCKIGALIAAATCTVILVIVVPLCTMKTWVHGTRPLFQGELVLFSVLYLFPVILLANIKMTVSASVWQTLIQQMRIIYLTYLFFQIWSFIVLLRTVRDSSFIWWSSKMSWIYYCSQGTIFLFFGIMYSVFWAKLFLMNYLVECEIWTLILLSFLSNGEHFK